MPAFTIVSDDGKQISSASLKGKVVLINFFATWCPPVRKNWRKYSRSCGRSLRIIKTLQMLVIDVNIQMPSWQSIMRKGFTFPLYPDKNRAIFGAFAKNLIPVLI